MTQHTLSFRADKKIWILIAYISSGIPGQTPQTGAVLAKSGPMGKPAFRYKVFIYCKIFLFMPE